MGKTRKIGDPGVADMNLGARVEPYRRPPVAEVREYPIDYGLGWVIHVRAWRYNGRLVDYALNHHVEDEPTAIKDVARIDCCHQHIHEHQFFRSGADEKLVELRKIDKSTAWATMEDEFPRSHDHMVDNWEKHLERWNRG